MIINILLSEIFAKVKWSIVLAKERRMIYSLETFKINCNFMNDYLQLLSAKNNLIKGNKSWIFLFIKQS